MKEYIICDHGSSRNHGCEAIVRSTAAMLDRRTITYSKDYEADHIYGLDRVTDVRQIHNTAESVLVHMYAAAARRLLGSYRPLIKYEYKDALKLSNHVILAAGGDNYCNGHPKRYVEINRLLTRNNTSVLWGCSITPELLKDREIVEDMNRYSLIVARESITYKALLEAGVRTRLELFPDPAFTLKPEAVELPEGFEPGKTIGINLSPLVGKAGGETRIMDGVRLIIQHILDRSQHTIALIPHVVWDKSNDMIPLKALYDQYRDTGRVILVDPDQKLNCCQLKYIISQCRMLVAARTHASIAAYSSMVPVMVLGYSVKSRGIGHDIFQGKEDYVVPVHGVSAQAILDRYRQLEDDYEEVKLHLNQFMPDYISKAAEAGRLLTEIR